MGWTPPGGIDFAKVGVVGAVRSHDADFFVPGNMVQQLGLDGAVAVAAG